MSNIDKTADITPNSGMDLRSTARTKATPYVQNVIPRNGDFWVRPGFGLVRQYSSTLSAGRVGEELSTNYGIGACIGATTVRTSWDADQILAIHPLYAFTGDFYGQEFAGTPLQTPEYGRRATILAGVVAIVHDLKTNRKTEFVLHEQDAQKDDLTKVYPNYATRYNDDRSTWAIPSHEPKWAIFAPMNTGIAFGTKAFNVVVCIDGMGLWTYRPVDNPRAWSRQNNSLDRPYLNSFMGEQGAFSPLNLAEGLLSANDGAVYLTTSDIGTITAQCTWNEDRVIYASGNTLWFSDPHMPQAVLADSRYVVPTSDPITCVAPLRSSVFIATSGGKCWAYQPALGSAGTAAVGSLTSISLTNGCVNNRAWAVGNEGIYFVDANGIFLWTGGIQLIWLSRSIDRLWTDPQSLELPLTDYYQRNGNTSLQSVQLPARIDMRQQMQNARLVWDDIRKTLLCVCDDVTLCWTTDYGWSVWLFQTHAGSGAEVVGMANIASPTMIPVRENLYMIGGPDTVIYGDAENSAFLYDRSCYLLKLDRGGAIDRSTCMDAPIADVWYCSMNGYFVPNNVLRITVGANHYDWGIAEGDDFAATYKAFAQYIQSIGDPDYNFIAQPGGIVAVGKAPGVSLPAVVTSVPFGSGAFVAVHTQTAAASNLVDADLEDWREPVSGWVKYYLSGDQATSAAFYLGPPLKADPGFTPPRGALSQTTQTYWWPLAIANVNSAPSSLALHFKFDNTRWRPICVPGILGNPQFGEMAFIAPAERLASVAGYRPNNHNATHQVCVYTSSTGVESPFGDEIRVNFDGTGGAWSTAPKINAGVVGPDVLMYLGFQYIGDSTTFSLHPSLTAISIGAQSALLYAWQSGRYPTEYEALSLQQQPVDWAVKSREFEVGGFQFTIRGVFITAMHMGNGTNDVVPGWLYGPLNTTTSTDWRDYSGQALDFASIPPGVSAQNDILAFPRMVPSDGAGNPDLSFDPLLKTFNNIATWGSTSDHTKGDLLVDDPAVDTLATTDGSKGMRGSVMVHGTMNAPGEVVKLGRIEAAIKQVGLRQRWGK